MPGRALPFLPVLPCPSCCSILYLSVVISLPRRGLVVILEQMGHMPASGTPWPLRYQPSPQLIACSLSPPF